MMILLPLLLAFSLIIGVNAQLTISSPAQGSVWESNSYVLVTWSGNCSQTGVDPSRVNLIIYQGPAISQILVSSTTVKCADGNALVKLPPAGAGSVYRMELETVPRSPCSGEFQIVAVASITPTASTWPSPINTRPSQTPTATTTSTRTPTTTTTNPAGTSLPAAVTNSPSQNEPKESHVGLIVGISGGVIVIVCLALLLVWKRRSRKSKSKDGGSINGLGYDSTKVEVTPLNEPKNEMIQQYQYNNVTESYQAPPLEYAFNFSSHPKPNVVTTAYGMEEVPYQGSLPIWEPKPFIPPPPSVSTRPGDPQFLPSPYTYAPNNPHA